MITTGIAYDYKDGVAIKTTRPPVDNLSNEVTIVWSDARHISAEQRRKAYALLGEIVAWSGEELERVKLTTKHDYLKRHIDGLNDELFSLSDCDMTTAREYITYLVDFIIEYGVPTNRPLTELCDDIGRYVYACFTHKVCAVCGKHCDLHHVDAVGMGNNRRKIDHIGLRCLPLCREHHMEAHNIGDDALIEKYHLQPVRIDDRIATLYKLGRRKEYEDETV